MKKKVKEKKKKKKTNNCQEKSTNNSNEKTIVEDCTGLGSMGWDARTMHPIYIVHHTQHCS